MTPRPNSRAPLVRFLVAACAIGVVGAGLCDSLRAADPAEQQKNVEQRLKLMQAKAKADVAHWESVQQAVGAERLSGLLNDDPPLIAALLKAFTENNAARRGELQVISADLKARLDVAERKWKAATLETLNMQEEIRSSEALYEFNWQENRPPEFELGWTGWLVLFWWLLVMSVGVALLVHERRRQFRHSQRTKSSVIATILICSFCLSGLSSCAPPNAAGGGGALRPEDALLSVKEQTEKINKDYLDDKGKADANRDKALQKWQTLLGDKVGPEFREQDRVAVEEVRKILIDAKLAETLSQDTSAQSGQLQADREKLASLIKQSSSQNTKFRLLRVAGCILGGALAFAPLLLVRRRLANQSKKEATICPRCLAEGTLKAVASKARDKDGKMITREECSKCRFRFASGNEKLARISYPTTGLKSSGKTQWLLTALDQVSNSLVNAEATIETDLTQVSPVIRQLLTTFKRQRVGPRATTFSKEVPEPLTFSLRDADRWGPLGALVSVFDFSGEVMDRRIYDDELRQRALKMDGFMLFLDPTQLDDAAPGKGRSSETLLDLQKDQVTNFYLELRKVRGVDDGDVVRVPVAVCVTKFDLLVTQNPIGEGARRMIDQLRKLKPQHHLTRELLAKRSELCRQMLPVMFQGWDVDAALRKRFGESIMYFPMSSVSLIDAELGETDLTKRNFEPFGILEPFLWLLHMHGFCIFED